MSRATVWEMWAIIRRRDNYIDWHYEGVALSDDLEAIEGDWNSWAEMMGWTEETHRIGKVVVTVLGDTLEEEMPHERSGSDPPRRVLRSVRRGDVR